ncbi:MAG: C_GCAxxG_C_C family protein [Treponema sp.]|nr:C_GCAxxG_C_C family protein [Treponema sp.]
MNHKENAVNYFSQKLHCSQAVLAAFAKECGLTEEQALRIGSCFGSGMRKGEVCGAVTGALMVLGLLYGQKCAGDADGRQLSDKVNDLMMDRFKEKCGSYLCNDLLGFDVRTKEGLQYCRDNKLFTEFCPKMVASAVDVVEEIILEQKVIDS